MKNLRIKAGHKQDMFFVTDIYDKIIKVFYRLKKAQEFIHD